MPKCRDSVLSRQPPIKRASFFPFASQRSNVRSKRMKFQLVAILLALLSTMALTMPQSLKQAKNQVPLKLTSQYVVDYLANLLLKTAPLNYLDIPGKFKKLPISQLTICVTKMQHTIIDVCILDVDDPTLPLDDRTIKILECGFESVAAYDPVKKTIDKVNLKEAFIGLTSLTEDKKKSAGLYADRCFSQEKLHLPKSFSNQRALGKAIVCLTKALAKNDCDLATRE